MFLWIRRMQFDNPAEVFSTQSWKLISQCPKRVWRFKTHFSSKLSSGHVGWSFDNPTEIFPTNAQKLIVQCPKVMKFSLKIVYSFKTFLLTSKIGFWWLRREFFDKKPQFSHSRPKNCETLFWKKKFFFQKVKGFYGRVECSFDNLAEVFWTQSWKLISQCPKMVWRFKTLFSSKLSSGHVGWSFDNPTEIFPTNGQKLIVQCPKVMKFSLKIVYSFKTFLLTSKIGFWWLRREFFDKKPQFSLSRPKIVKLCSEKKFFFKNERFLWTRRMQFWQSRWSFLDAELKTYLSMSENGMKIQNIIFLETLLWTRRMEFWQPDRNFSDEWSKTYRSMSESDEIFSQNSILFQNVPINQ